MFDSPLSCNNRHPDRKSNLFGNPHTLPVIPSVFPSGSFVSEKIGNLVWLQAVTIAEWQHGSWVIPWTLNAVDSKVALSPTILTSPNPVLYLVDIKIN